MSTRRIHRRAVLRGIGGIALALPFLDAMRGDEARADGATPPKRFVGMFSPNGTIPDAWSPRGTERDFTFGEILAPLTEHKADLLVLKGVRMASTRKGPGSAHMKGVGHMLTARPLLEGDFHGGGGATSGWGSGISVDQEMAKDGRVVGSSRFKSLQLGVRVQSSDVRGRISYLGSAQPIAPEGDPRVAFNTLFGDAGLDRAQIDAIQQDRKSVLDFVKADFEALDKQVSVDDRRKLDAHLTTIRDIEQRVDSLGTTLCTAPALGDLGGLGASDAPAIGKLQMDILVAALACDLTRVATFMWMNGTSGHSFPWLGISDDHHALSHEGDDNAGAKRKLIEINAWYAEQFAYLLGEMKRRPEGDGTLLDHTAILWGNELGKGNNHTRDDIPFVLAGSCGGYFKTGRYLAYEGNPSHSDLLVSLLNAMGIEASTFGDPDFCTGPLPRLVG